MLQPEKDVLEPPAANGAPNNNGYAPSDEPSHFEDPHSGGLSSSGAALLNSMHLRKHTSRTTQASCMQHSSCKGSTAQGLHAGCLPMSSCHQPMSLAHTRCNAEAEQQLRVHGRNELEEKTSSKLLIFLKLVRSPASVSLTISSTRHHVRCTDSSFFK